MAAAKSPREAASRPRRGEMPTETRAFAHSGWASAPGPAKSPGTRAERPDLNGVRRQRVQQARTWAARSGATDPSHVAGRPTTTSHRRSFVSRRRKPRRPGQASPPSIPLLNDLWSPTLRRFGATFDAFRRHEVRRGLFRLRLRPRPYARQRRPARRQALSRCTAPRRPRAPTARRIRPDSTPRCETRPGRGQSARPTSSACPRETPQR